MSWSESSRPARKIPVRIVDDGHGQVDSDRQVIEKDTPAVTSPSVNDRVRSPGEDVPDWKSVALRLQAEMDNFRRRQTLRADEAVGAERERLLLLMLSIADNLDRALGHTQAEDRAFRQGVELTLRELMRLLEAEGVVGLEAVGQPFNPEWHEAVAVEATGVEVDTIVREVEKGYRLGDKLLRPARVVVAV
jgi:molecular chaperone GrpE